MKQYDLFADAKAEESDRVTIKRVTLYARPVESLPPEARSTFPPRDLAARAEAWIKMNPGGYAMFLSYARLAAGRKQRFGAKALAERVRWSATVEGTDQDFALNNSFIAYIARKLVRDDPTLAPFIEFREARCAASATTSS